MVDVEPSPNVQLDEAIAPSVSVLVFVNAHVSALQLEVKFAVGGLFGGGDAVTVTCFVTLFDSEPSLTVNVTLYVPAEAYV